MAGPLSAVKRLKPHQLPARVPSVTRGVTGAAPKLPPPKITIAQAASREKSSHRTRNIKATWTGARPTFMLSGGSPWPVVAQTNTTNSSLMRLACGHKHGKAHSGQQPTNTCPGCPGMAANIAFQSRTDHTRNKTRSPVWHDLLYRHCSSTCCPHAACSIICCPHAACSIGSLVLLALQGMAEHLPSNTDSIPRVIPQFSHLFS